MQYKLFDRFDSIYALVSRLLYFKDDKGYEDLQRKEEREA